MRKILALALFLIVISSLCVHPGRNTAPLTPFSQQQGGGGVVIKKFSLLPNRLLPGSKVSAVLVIKNVGERDTTVTAEIFGFDPSQIKLSRGVSRVQIEPLKGSDPNTGFGGEEKTIVWRLEASRELEVPQEVETPVDIWARITYEYETIAIGKVKLLSLNEYAMLESEGKIKESTITVENTNSPILLSVESKNPLVVGSNLIVKVKLINRGNGLVKNHTVDLELIVKDAGIYCRKSVNDVFLRKSKEGFAVLRCDLPENLEVPSGEYTVEIVAKYTYYEDVKATLYLTKQPQ